MHYPFLSISKSPTALFVKRWSTSNPVDCGNTLNERIVLRSFGEKQSAMCNGSPELNGAARFCRNLMDKIVRDGSSCNQKIDLMDR